MPVAPLCPVVSHKIAFHHAFPLLFALSEYSYREQIMDLLQQVVNTTICFLRGTVGPKWTRESACQHKVVYSSREIQWLLLSTGTASCLGAHVTCIMGVRQGPSPDGIPRSRSVTSGHSEVDKLVELMPVIAVWCSPTQMFSLTSVRREFNSSFHGSGDWSLGCSATSLWKGKVALVFAKYRLWHHILGGKSHVIGQECVPSTESLGLAF